LRRLLPEDVLMPAPSGGPSPVLGWIFLIALAGVAIWLLSRLRFGARRRSPDEDDPLVLSERERQRPPAAWLAEAERLELAEQWKAALRCRFRALVGELTERQLVRDLPGRTSGELRADLRRTARPAAAPFARASRLFDAAWYGDAPTGRAESELFRRLADEVLAAGKAAGRDGIEDADRSSEPLETALAPTEGPR
jgi:hypothetical protein